MEFQWKWIFGGNGIYCSFECLIYAFESSRPLTVLPSCECRCRQGRGWLLRPHLVCEHAVLAWFGARSRCICSVFYALLPVWLSVCLVARAGTPPAQKHPPECDPMKVLPGLTCAFLSSSPGIFHIGSGG